MGQPWPDDLVVARDTREQRPYRFERQVDKALRFGDYACAGRESEFALERKEFVDFIRSVTTDHDRLEREIERALLAGGQLVFIVEGAYSRIVARQYIGAAHPNAILGWIANRTLEGICVLFVDTRDEGNRLADLLLRKFWIRSRGKPLRSPQLAGETV